MDIFSELELCPRELSPCHLETFAREGFLAFRDVLTPDETEGARTALTQLIRSIAKGPREQVGAFWVKPDSRFGVQFEVGTLPDAIDESLELKVRKLMWFVDEHPHLGMLARSHERIRAVIQGLLGNGPEMFQDMALIKPPFIGSEKPWHQDNAYFSVAPLEAVCGVWIALDDATAENGCMHVLPGCHREVRKHIHDRDCEIPASSLPLKLARAVELPAGGALFFAGMLPHQTPPNNSAMRRRALQLHYRAAGSRLLPRADYDELYREYDGMTGESIPASCANRWKA